MRTHAARTRIIPVNIPIGSLLMMRGSGGRVTLVILHIHQVPVQPEHGVAGRFAARRPQDKAARQRLARFTTTQRQDRLPSWNSELFVCRF
jgi:hypothetical protein